jgi:hypothetical protein
MPGNHPGRAKGMAALTIMIIRHAEKPDPKFPEWGEGVNIVGDQDPNSLAVLGWQRIGCSFIVERMVCRTDAR